MINLLKNIHFYFLFYTGIPQYLFKHLIKKQSQVRGKKSLISKLVSSFKSYVSVLHLSCWIPFTCFYPFHCSCLFISHSSLYSFTPSFLSLLYLPTYFLSVKNIYVLFASHFARVPGTEVIAVVSVFC